MVQKGIYKPFNEMFRDRMAVVEEDLRDSGVKVLGCRLKRDAKYHRDWKSFDGFVEIEARHRGNESKGVFFYHGVWPDAIYFDRTLAGYAENAGLSVPLVSYRRRDKYVLTPYMGPDLKELMGDRLMMELMEPVGRALSMLNRPTGDPALRNVLLKKRRYTGPAITRPDSGRELLFFDYDFYGSTPPLLDPLGMMADVASIEPERRRLREACERIGRGYGKMPTLEDVELLGEDTITAVSSKKSLRAVKRVLSGVGMYDMEKT